MNHYQIPAPSSQRGMSLLEVLIAVLIFSFGILALAGLQGSMIKNTSEVKNRSDAAFIAQQQLGILWSDPANLSSYVTAGAVPLPTVNGVTQLPQGTMQISLPSGAATGEVKVEIKWQEPGQPQQHRYVTYGRVTGGA